MMPKILKERLRTLSEFRASILPENHKKIPTNQIRIVGISSFTYSTDSTLVEVSDLVVWA